MKKRILSLAMALTVCLGLTLPAFAAVTHTETFDGITITLNSNGTISYTGTGTFTEDHAVLGVRLLLEITEEDPREVTISFGSGITGIPDKSMFIKNFEICGLVSVTINYASDSTSTVQPSTPTQPVTPAKDTAKASTQTVTVDGKAVEFQMYALLDANGNGTNYIKLRDMAYVLNGTDAQFSVGYDNATKTITVTTGQAYSAAGGEMTTPFSGDRSYQGGAQTLQVNGKAVSMEAITLTDDNGGGYNYFKLRDLGSALGFNVGWSKEAGVFIESDKPYAG